jgi:DNA-binding SARP family transcriptional activator
LEEWDMSAGDASPDPPSREEAWARLLFLERQVRELRQMLLAGDREGASDSRPASADIDVRPTPFSAHAKQPADWQVTCLGPFRIEAAGRAVAPCSSRRGWAILQYLLVRPGRLAARDVLIEAFWPGAAPSAGAHRLQMAIHALRRSLREHHPSRGGHEAVLFHDGQYALNPALVIDVDVDRFRAACERGRRLARAGQREAARRAFEEALVLYGGPFLDESPHDEWAETQRVALQDLRLGVLAWLSDAYAARSEWEPAAACCREIIAADPYREDAIRQLLHCLAATGRLAEVERAYRAARDRLWRDLQVEPAAETTRAYHQLTRAAVRHSALAGS